MAFTLYASTGSTTTQLNDGSPFRFESIEGLSGAGALRHEQRGPLQHGATDLGYRLQPRVITLSLVFSATTDALLDTYRATLMAAFKPLDEVSTVLSVQRDDGEIRLLTVYRVGDINVDLAPELRPGHMHRATVRLRAANPLWRSNSVTQGSATFTALTNWTLAGGAISQSSVLGSVTYPAAEFGMSGGIGTATGDWSIGFVTSKDLSASDASAHYILTDRPGGAVGMGRMTIGTTTFFYDGNAASSGAMAWPFAVGDNYLVVESRSGTQYWRYWNNTTLVAYGGTAVDLSLRYGASFTWRGDSDAAGYAWPNEIRKGIILGTVTVSQLNALGPYMLDKLPGTVTLVNDGDTPAYPLLTLRGPLADPVIVNTTAGGTINLSGGTLAATDTWTIDLRDGNKRIYNQQGSVVMSYMGTPAQLAGFSLAPAPIATGGTNVLVMTPGSVGAAAYFSAEIQNQYMSF